MVQTEISNNPWKKGKSRQRGEGIRMQSQRKSYETRKSSENTKHERYLKASLSRHQSSMSVPRVLSPQEDGNSLLKPSDHLRAGEIKCTQCVIKPGPGGGHLLSVEPAECSNRSSNWAVTQETNISLRLTKIGTAANPSEKEAQQRWCLL